VAGENVLIGELALVVAMARPATAVALEPSSVLRISRSLFQRVLESHPEAARRLRDDFAARSNAALGAMTRVGATLRCTSPQTSSTAVTGT
jgi:CRP-like cAMP-binding protein